MDGWLNEREREREKRYFIKKIENTTKKHTYNKCTTHTQKKKKKKKH